MNIRLGRGTTETSKPAKHKEMERTSVSHGQIQTGALARGSIFGAIDKDCVSISYSQFQAHIGDRQGWGFVRGSHVVAREVKPHKIVPSTVALLQRSCHDLAALRD